MGDSGENVAKYMYFTDTAGTHSPVQVHSEDALLDRRGIFMQKICALNHIIGRDPVHINSNLEFRIPQNLVLNLNPLPVAEP